MRHARFGACLLMLLSLSAAGSSWETNYEKALAKAKADGKTVLLNFSGSDWCVWCQRLDSEVFNKTAFKKFARSELVCVLIDTPRRKSQSKKLAAQSAALKKQHDVRFFPTIVLLGPDGAQLARTGYEPGGAANYVKHLKTLLAAAADKAGDAAEPDDGKKAGSAPAARTWTNTRGQKLTGTFVSQTATDVTIRRKSGKLIHVELEKLSEADRAYLASLAEK